MTAVCPRGHVSRATDYCDTCGAPLDGQQPTPPAVDATADLIVTETSAAKPCPHCRADNLGDALFCESCGYDFTTGSLPRGDVPTGEPAPPAAPAGTGWVVEVWVDPDWHALQASDVPCPSPGLPHVVPLTERSNLIGRRSTSRNITPQVDVVGDTAVSRRQAQLTTDGTRWWVEDLQSSNGTYVGTVTGALPTVPLKPGDRRELTPGDRIYLGAWTRLVVRRTAPGD